MVLISGNNFNTSHVTVYRMESLSLTIPSTKFQYISCYGLSSLASYDVALNPDFNTSHVTVYQKLLILMLLSHTHFNTSHVTVYRISDAILSTIFSYFNTSHVTVYRLADDLGLKITVFQYISCYGLSW